MLLWHDTNLADPTLYTQLLMRGKGKESNFVTELTFLMSVQNSCVFSGFETNTQGDTQLDVDGMNMLFRSMYSTSGFN